MEPELIVLTGAQERAPLPPVLKSVPTAAILDAEIGAAGIGTPIGAVSNATRFAGIAITATFGNLAQWKALEIAGPGDVLVISTHDRRNCAEFGAVYVGIAKRKGIAAIVTDGLLRDKDEIAALGFPVFAAGVHPASPPDPECGTVGMPVLIAGVQITTGDAVVGDSDGIAIVKHSQFGNASQALARQADKEYSLHDSAESLPPSLADMLKAYRTVELKA
jgi:4-hydroxy-4-methyl-2-oxoglutarate aldolase